MEGQGTKKRKRTTAATTDNKRNVVLKNALGKNPPSWCEIHLEDKKFVDLFPNVESWAMQDGDEEEPQTFEQFKTMERYKVTKTRNKLYLLPIGEFPEDAPPLELFEEFLNAYFCLDSKILSPISVQMDEDGLSLFSHPWLYPIKTVTSKDYKGMNRLYTMDVLRVLKEFLPKDGYCVFGLTMEDLYEHHSKSEKHDSIILGRGSGDRVGCVSMLRFDPLIDKRQQKSDSNSKKNKKSSVHCSDNEKKLWFIRTCKTMAHEVMHMFGLDHCVYFSCCMNGSVSPDGQDDRDPMWLCPIDLRKLQFAIKFDCIERYKALVKFFDKHDFPEEVAWLNKRLDFLSG